MDLKTFFVRFLALQKNQNTETTLWKQIKTVKYTLLLKKKTKIARPVHVEFHENFARPIVFEEPFVIPPFQY